MKRNSARAYIHRFLKRQLWLVVLLCPAVSPLLGQSLYWDVNGTSTGAGGVSPAGVWNLTNAFWNNAAGDGTAVAWANSGTEIANFSAGTDAIGSYAITLGAGSALKLASLTVSLGNVSLASLSGADGLDFGTSLAAIQVNPGASLVVSAAISGSAGLTKTGTGTLVVNTSSLPTGAYVVQAGELQLGSGVTANIGALTIGGGAGVSATLTLDSSAVLNLGGNITYSSSGAPLAGLIQGGTFNLNGNRTITVQNISADPDITIQSVLADGSTVSNFTKAGAGSLLISNATAYTGSTIVSAGVLHVQGNTASLVSSSALNINAAATANLGSATDSVAVNRLGDNVTVTLTGGSAGGATLNYTGANFATQAVHTETAGALIFAGAHRSVLTVTAGSGDEVVLSFASLTRQDQAVGVVRGSNLATAAGTADSARVLFTTAPTMVGGIVPWLLGDVSTTGVGSAFVTYDTTVGLRLLSGADFTAPGAGMAGANVQRTLGTTTNVTSSVNVNSWTNANTGTTSLSSGVTLGITSGAMLFTSSGTFSGGTLNFAGSSEGIFHLSATVAVTATINSTVAGSNGIILSGAGNGNKILALGGNNTFTGGVRVYGGILQLNNAGALNATGVNALTVQTGTVRLNGQQVTVAGLDGDGTVNNNSSTTSVLIVKGGGTFTGTLVDGSTASLGLTKSGNATLTLQGNNQFTGATLVEQGVLVVGGGNSSGRLSGTASVMVKQGAILRISNTSGTNVLTDRINDTATVTLAGGTLDFNTNAAANTDYSELIGSLQLNAGANSLLVDQATAGRTSTLSLSSITRQTGATVNFTGGSSGLGVSTRNRLDVAGLSAGFVGGWATQGADFVKYVVDIDSTTSGNQGSITAFTADDYSVVAQSSWSSTLHVKPTADQTLDAARQVASANLASGMDLALNGNVLTIVSGGLIKQGGAVGATGAGVRSQITNGTVTAGTTANAELFVRVTGANLNITATVSDNTAGAVNVAKSGAGTLLLGGVNTYTGATWVNEGTLIVGTGGTGANMTQASSIGRTGSGTTTVNAAGVLTGTGLVQGNLVLNGGAVRPGDTSGDARGTLWVGGNMTFTAGSVAMQVTTATLNKASLANAGSSDYATALAALASDANLQAAITTAQHDHLEVVGTFDWDTGTGKVSVINNGYTAVAGDVFNLLDWAQVSQVGSVNVSTGLELFDLGAGFMWDTSLWATQGVLIVTTPEPSRAVLLLAGLALVSLRRRRFNRVSGMASAI